MRSIVIAAAILFFGIHAASAQGVTCLPALPDFDTEIYNAPTDGTVIEIEDSGHRIRAGSTGKHFGLFKFEHDPRYPDPAWVSVDGSTILRFDAPCLAWRAYSGNPAAYVAPDGLTELQRQCAHLRATLSSITPIPMCKGVK